MVGINWLRPTFLLSTYELSYFFQTLQVYSNLTSPKFLAAEAEKELTLIEQRLQEAYVFKLILSLIVFGYFAFNSLFYWAHYAKESSIMEWISLAHKQSKKLKLCVERCLT